MAPKVFCVLCQRSEETKITGPLATKDEVTAHQNCLLFSSGIFCRDSPMLHDLFGFYVEDVMDEVKRGNKLICSKCKRKGATAGCEVKRCKKSYHYPCALEEGAESFEDEDQGNYGLYCSKHSKKMQGNNSSVNGSPSPQIAGTSKNPSEAASSKVNCLACEKTEGNISLESLSNIILIMYCDKHAPTSHKRNASGDSAAAGLSLHSSDSNSSSSTKHLSSKRRLSFGDKPEESPSKRKFDHLKKIISSDSSDSDENVPAADMEMYAPLESDLEESANSVPEVQVASRKDTENPTGSAKGSQVENQSKNENIDEDETDVDSISLLPPGMDCLSPSTKMTEQTTQTASPAHQGVKCEVQESSPEQSPVPQQSSPGPPPSPDHSRPPSVTGSPPRSISAVLPPPANKTVCETLPSSTESPAGPPSDPEPGMDSASFWKSCNMAGCTQEIFADFINEITEVSGRIQSEDASQEDYDLALKVMEVSGKLAELVSKQQRELQRKQMELQKAVNAMNEVVSALRR